LLALVYIFACDLDGDAIATAMVIERATVALVA
jgi:hypothetical protein